MRVIDEHPANDRAPANPPRSNRGKAARDLAIAIARPADRRALSALFALDARLGAIAAAAREPLIGQIRLTWWREALRALDGGPAPAEPLLQRVQEDLVSCGVVGAALAAMTDGWEALVATDAPLLADYAVGRGAALFGMAAVLLGMERSDRTDAAGEGWALADLAGRSRDPRLAGEARDLADERFVVAFAGRWAAPLRPVGVLALLARFDNDPAWSRARQLYAVLRFRLTGR